MTSRSTATSTTREETDMPAPSTRNDPFKNFNFLVEIDGIAPAAFKSVSGLSAEVEVIEYRSGADTLTSSRKLPGRVRYSNVTLTRGITSSRDLWDWWRTVVEVERPAAQRRDRPPGRLPQRRPALAPAGRLDRQDRRARARRGRQRGGDRDRRARPRGARARLVRASADARDIPDDALAVWAAEAPRGPRRGARPAAEIAQ